jgi:hypothetical protein
LRFINPAYEGTLRGACSCTQGTRGRCSLHHMPPGSVASVIHLMVLHTSYPKDKISKCQSNLGIPYN